MPGPRRKRPQEKLLSAATHDIMMLFSWCLQVSQSCIKNCSRCPTQNKEKPAVLFVSAFESTFSDARRITRLDVGAGGQRRPRALQAGRQFLSMGRIRCCQALLSVTPLRSIHATPSLSLSLFPSLCREPLKSPKPELKLCGLCVTASPERKQPRAAKRSAPSAPPAWGLSGKLEEPLGPLLRSAVATRFISSLASRLRVCHTSAFLFRVLGRMGSFRDCTCHSVVLGVPDASMARVVPLARCTSEPRSMRSQRGVGSEEDLCLPAANLGSFGVRARSAS